MPSEPMYTDPLKAADWERKKATETNPPVDPVEHNKSFKRVAHEKPKKK
jgi:hypothetical protein